MSFCTFKFSLLVRTAFAVCLVLFTSTAMANDREYKTGEVYVIINSSNENLLQLFKIIEKQTPFSFAYDENDINLKAFTRATTPKRLLAVFQTSRTSLKKKNIILVSGDKKNAKIAAIPTVKVVRDANDAPLQARCS
jgi:hypothetical protein